MIAIAPDLWLFPGNTEWNDRDRATRRVVAHALECDLDQVRITIGPSGKPYVTEPSSKIFFNRAHRPGCWCLALAQNEVGVDLEPLPIQQDWPLVAKHLFSQGEQRWLHSLPPAFQNEAFARLWTGKEAVLKAQNTGISSGIVEPDFGNSLKTGPWPDIDRHQVATKSGDYDIEWIKYSPDHGPQFLISRSRRS